MTPPPLPPVDVRSVPPDDVLLDVREPHEWVAGHAPGAVHVPMSQLVERLGELPTDRPLSVICHLGGRSAQVAAYLAQRGYDARNVDGGMDAWERVGLPVVTDDGRPGQVL